MANLGIGMLSSKNSKHHYFKQRDKQGIENISSYREELPYKKKISTENESVVVDKRVIDMKQIEKVLNKKTSLNGFPL